MRDVPPVDVDIILDPFLYNVLPRSLLPTVGYILVVAAIAWFLSGRIVALFQQLIRAHRDDEPAQQKKKQ